MSLGQSNAADRWSGLRNLALAGVSLIALTSGAALAQAPQANGVLVAQADRQASFNIPAQSLDGALAAFGAATGYQVLYGSGLAANLTSPGFAGQATPSAALSRILTGTGVSYRFTGANAVTLERDSASGVLPTISVEADMARESAWGPVSGYVATRSATATKTDASILEIPQTVNVVTADQIKAQQAQNIGQALRYTPGVMSETFGAVSQWDIFTQVRGFRPNFYQDGTRLPYGAASTGFGSTVADPYGLERLEVLKGPASDIYGQSAPGGLINMVSKRPTDEPLHEVQAQIGSFDRYQGAFDLGGPISESSGVNYRLTGLLRESDTQVDFIENNRFMIAPAISARLDDATKLTLLSNYQSEWGGETLFNYQPVSGTLGYNVNGRIPRERYTGDPDYDHLDREQYSAGYLLEHEVSDAITLRQNLRYSHVEFDAQALTMNGVLAPGSQVVGRVATRTEAQSDAITIDNNAQFDFATGAFSHVALVGADFRRETNDFKFGRGAAPGINVYNPVYGVPITPIGFNIQRLDAEENQVGTYLNDQIKFDRWVLTLGGRYDRAESASYNHNNRTVTEQDDDAMTGRAGLSYLFANGITPYVSYAESFQPTPGASFTGQPFVPSTGTQYEAGVKYQPPGSNSLYTMSVFDITQQGRTANDSGHPGFMLQLAEVNVRGFEIEARTQLTSSFALIGGYAYLEHEITKSNLAAEVGRPINNTPKHQASLWGDYRFKTGALAGLGLGAGVRHTGETYDLSTTLKMPSYTLADAMLSYDMGRFGPDFDGMSFQLNVSNLFDTYYLPACNTTAGCTVGGARTVLATVTYNW